MDAAKEMSEDDFRKHQQRIAENRGLSLDEYLERYKAGEFGEFNNPQHKDRAGD